MSRKPAVRTSFKVAPSQHWPLDLASLAVSALIDEAELTPKPALVDRRGNGAHHDLDLSKVLRSAHTLKDGFEALARASAAARPSEQVREELGRIGREMERRMLTATGGSNSHRGAIWTLGLLVAAAARRRSDLHAVGIAAGAAAFALMPDKFAPDLLSHGHRARLRFGAAGARGEAQAAFPHAIRVGLPGLRNARARGVPEDTARLDALMAIMSSLEDTCLLHRGGRMALEAARAGARAVLAAGGSGTKAGYELLLKLDAGLMLLWASPGGSADLLAATLFLDRLESLDEANTVRSQRT
jgi:triphosphoribosyl-dephospho-CoA synthase